MEELAMKQSGFIKIESVYDPISERGITVSYWESLDSISNWKQNLNHQRAQQLGKKQFYSYYSIHITEVKRNYSFQRDKQIKSSL